MSHASRFPNDNLLIAYVAVLYRYIPLDAFVKALREWIGNKNRPIADILQAQGCLQNEDVREDLQSRVDSFVEDFKKRHSFPDPPPLSDNDRDALLALSDDELQDFFSRTLLLDSPTLTPDGRFRKMRRIGEGGVGLIFLARDKRLQRAVVLKELHPSHVVNRQNARRFNREAKFTARLNHPGIVSVISRGKYKTGRPFYTMDLIRGHSLGKAIDSFHSANAEKQFQADGLFGKLLERFCRVCEVVAYAHGKDVLHRDLKPGNIMIDERTDETFVIDWGLAKKIPCLQTQRGPQSVTEPDSDVPATREADTRAGALLGTPSYASPEQEAGEPKLTTASDIYSLGATLYHLLTNRHPLAAGQRSKAPDQWKSPRQSNSAIPKDLEFVCLRAMALDPKDRYDSAKELAEAVTRWLTDRPVPEYPYPWPVRLGRWARNHPRSTASGFVSLLALLTILGVTVFYSLRLGRANENLVAANRRERIAADHARNTIENMTSPQALHFIETQPGLRPEQRQFLEKAVAYYQDVVAQQPIDRQDQEHQGHAYFRMGHLMHRLSLTQDARNAYGQAISIYDRLVAGYPAEPKYPQILAHIQNNLGVLLKEMGQWTEAENAHRAAIKLREQLVADFPTVREYRQELADSHNNLGVLWKGMGKWLDAEKAYRLALGLREQLVADFPTVPLYRQALAGSHGNLGILQAITGRPTDAEKAHRIALALQEKLVAEFPSVSEYRFDLANSYNNLANLLDDVGRKQEAEASYRKAVALQEKLVNDFHTVPAYRQQLAQTWNNVALLLARQGSREKAEPAYRQALTIQEKLLADFPAVPSVTVDLGATYCNFGHLVRERGAPAASLDWYIKAIGTLSTVLRKEPRLLNARLSFRDAHAGQAMALDQLDRYAEAVASWKQAIANNDEKARDGEFRLGLAASLARAGKDAEAVAVVKDVLKPENTQNAGSPSSETLYNAACVYAVAAAQVAKLAKGEPRPHLAHTYASQAIELLRQAWDKGFRNVAQLRQDPDLNALRGHSEFKKLLQDLDKPAEKK